MKITDIHTYGIDMFGDLIIGEGGPVNRGGAMLPRTTHKGRIII